MLENLFDWEYPDDKTNNYIKEYGKAKFEKDRSKLFLLNFAGFAILESLPFSLLLANIFTININERFDLFYASINITQCVIIFILFLIYYNVKIHYKKKKLLDITNNKVKIFNTVVRSKKWFLGKHIISVQLFEDKPINYRVDKKLYKNVDKGSSIVAIKYDNKNGFIDKYDFILNPNTILEEE